MCVINQDRCNEALLFAAIKHDEQKMMQPKVSYVAHLQGVCLEAISGCLNSNANVNLEKVIILSNNITISKQAFFGCSRLKEVMFIGEEIKSEDDVFEGCDELKIIKVSRKNT